MCLAGTPPASWSFSPAGRDGPARLGGQRRLGWPFDGAFQDGQAGWPGGEVDAGLSLLRRERIRGLSSPHSGGLRRALRRRGKVPETTVAGAGVGVPAEGVNRPAGGVARRWWRRAGVAFLMVLL